MDNHLMTDRGDFHSQTVTDRSSSAILEGKTVETTLAFHKMEESSISRLWMWSHWMSTVSLSIIKKDV